MKRRMESVRELKEDEVRQSYELAVVVIESEWE